MPTRRITRATVALAGTGMMLGVAGTVTRQLESQAKPISKKKVRLL